MIAAVVHFGATVFIRNFNNQLSTQLQSIEDKIEEYQISNDALKNEILQLKTRDRILSISEEYGLTYNPENIITITKND